MCRPLYRPEDEREEGVARSSRPGSSLTAPRRLTPCSCKAVRSRHPDNPPQVVQVDAPALPLPSPPGTSPVTDAPRGGRPYQRAAHPGWGSVQRRNAFTVYGERRPERPGGSQDRPPASWGHPGAPRPRTSPPAPAPDMAARPEGRLRGRGLGRGRGLLGLGLRLWRGSGGRAYRQRSRGTAPRGPAPP